MSLLAKLVLSKLVEMLTVDLIVGDMTLGIFAKVSQPRLAFYIGMEKSFIKIYFPVNQ